MSVELGTKAVLKIGDSTNALQDVSTYLTDSGLPRTVDSIEATTFGKTKKVYKPGLQDGTISLSGDWDVAIDGILDGIMGLADRNWEYYPQGVGTGLPKYSGLAMITKYETSDAVADLGKFTAELQQSDAITRAIQ